MAKHRLYKLTTLLKRRSDITEQEFHRYWSEKHPLVVNQWLINHGVVKYYHTPSHLREECEFGQGSSHIAEFDGYVELTVPNIDALKDAFQDPFYKSHVAPDEAAFIDAQETRRTFGYEELFIEGNKIEQD
ncbi:hypothetical protein E4T47_09513 [Aureobasidium subglaciale]|nr:hypothetical protein E4T47_09513 [Aureobasidium subglaciale]